MNGAGRILIVGIGSDFGDDRLGPVVARRLAARLPKCDVRELRSPLDLIDCPADVERWHVVDACRGAGPPGTIVRCDWPVADFATVRFSGTHDFGLLAALQLVERLQRLPPQVTIWSVEAADDEERPAVLAPLSPAVAVAAAELTDRIAAEVNDCRNSDEEPARHA